MTRRDISLSIALCASMTIHVLLSVALAERYVREVGDRIWLPGLQRSAEMVRFVPPQEEPDPSRRLGAPDAAGYAIDASPGELPQLAREGLQDQPFLSRDPAGMGEVGDAPSENLVAGSGAADAAATASPPVATVMPFAPDQSDNLIGIPTASVPPQQPAAPSKAGQAPAGGDGQRAADPAPKGDSEVDPMSVVGSVDFRRGSTDVRLGRKHKITRPRLTIDATLDMVQMGSTRLVLDMSLDDSGHVRRAEVQHSSGSKSLDQACKVAAYEWWFEPLTDATGNRVRDRFLFSITFH